MSKIIKLKQSVYIFFFSALLLSACGGDKNPESGEAAAEATEEAPVDEDAIELTAGQFKTAGITVGQVERKAISGILKVNGLIDVPPENLISITTQMGGIVKSTPLLQGSLVSKGQVIGVLQNQEYVLLQQEYLENRSQLDFADSEYKRQQELARQNVNSQKVLQQARSQYQTLLSRASALKQRLQLININAASLNANNIRSTINIYAPVSGYVTKVNVNVGKFVSPNDAMFEIVNGSNLHVELQVFEKDVNKIAKGQKVRFTLPNETEERNATVLLVGKEVNADKTVTVHCIASFQSKNLIPGSYITAVIQMGSNEVDALPESAVVDFEGKKYIFTQTEANPGHEKKEEPTYHFKIVEVTVGDADAGYIAVELPAEVNKTSSKIVTKGAYDLLSKMKNSEEEE